MPKAFIFKGFRLFLYEKALSKNKNFCVFERDSCRSKKQNTALNHDLVIFYGCVIISIPLFRFDIERLESDTEIGSFSYEKNL